jgi:hypothetical protein
MIDIPLVNDEVICVDEPTAGLLARCHVAFINVVLEGETLLENEFHSLAIYALFRLKVLARTRNVAEDGIAYHLRKGAKLTTRRFGILCDLLEARLRALNANDGSFLMPTSAALRRLERRLHLSETFEQQSAG